VTPTPFDDIRGHEALRGTLSQALESRRVASALLFHGPPGVGKLSVALALFRALFCENPGGPCGACDSCRRILGESVSHPDLALLFPRRARDDAKQDKGDSSAASGAVDLHLLQDEIRMNPSWRILADSTRESLSGLHLSPRQARRRGLLILFAERLGNVSGNILLKALEEPPGKSVIVLLTESPSALLPTIRSRCQACRFAPLARSEVESYLKERAGASPETSQRIASLSGGRIGSALALARDSDAYLERRDLLSRLLSETRRDSAAAVCLAAAGVLLAEPEGTLEDLSILMDILRDAMLAGAGAPAARLTRQPGPLDPAIPPLQAAFLLARVEKAREDLRRNVNRQIALEALFLDLAASSLSDSDD
jgi:DNA polymerase III subunit delta'